MLRLRYPVIALTLSLFLASSVAAQQTEGEIRLTGNEIHVQIAPAATAATLIPFQVEVNGRDDDGFDVTVANAGAIVSLILPGGTEINNLNAAAFGYGWEVMAADSEAVTSGLFISPFSRSGNHTFIGLPSTATAGTYHIKINTSNVTTDTFVSASYVTASPIRVGLLSDNPSYTAGQPVVLSAFVFNGTTPITNATVEGFVMDKDHPETAPVQVTFSDSGPDDVASGDGIYTGVYTASTTGKFIASLRANGNSPAGFPYVRMTSTEFRVLPALATFTSFSDAGVDDNGNSLFDRIVVTANLQVQQAGNYRLHLSLVAGNGQEAQASATATLGTNAQQMSVSFTATQIAELGVNGPYTIRNATLFYTGDPEEPIAAFSENGGQTAAYALTSLEREVVKFTGNNSVAGIDTNSNGKFDILHIQVELNTLAAATYNWSGTLKDSTGRNIQAIDGTTAMSAGNNTLTFDFDGIKIAQNGVDGPYTLASVLVFNEQIAVHVDELLKTQAFSINDFECSDAPAGTVQSATLTPTSVIGGNATTLHVTLAQAAGACGVKVTITSNNPAVIAAAIPATIIVPAGQTSADFSIITAGVSAATQVDLTATSGISSQTATLGITPSALTNLSLSLTVVQAGNGSNAKLELDGAAPLGGTTISMSSSNSNVASVPATAVIPAGQRSIEVPVNTNPAFEGAEVVNISGTLGAVTKSASITVYSEVFINGSITPGGAAVTVTATQPGQNFVLSFNGNAGQRISLRMTDVSFGNSSCCGANISIKKPDGSILVSPSSTGTAGSFIDATQLPVSGTYTILVDPVAANTGSATLTLYDVPPDVSETIVAGGSSVTVSTTTPGQNAQLTFTGSAGQRVSVNITGVTISLSDVYVKKPDGTNLVSTSFGTAGDFINPLVLPVAGTYTILIDPRSYNTGSVTARLYDVPADVSGTITAGGSAVSVTTTVPGQAALLTFNGTVGQRVSLKITGVSMSGGNGYVDVYLKRPDNSTLGSASFISSSDFIDAKVIDQNGTHTILIDPQGTNTGSVTLTLYNVPADVSGTITIGGATVTVTTTVPGQNGQLSFSGTANQRVTMNISNVNLTGGNGFVDVTIKKPDNSTLASSSFIGSGGAFINTQTLPVTGTYTVFVNPQSSNTGSVSFTLNDVSADVIDTITPGGPPVTVTTTVPGQNAQVTFDGTASQRISLKISGVSMTGGNGFVDIRIKNPDGSWLTNTTTVTSSGGFVDTRVLPVTGTYTILVDPQGTNIGSVTLTLYDVPADITGPIVAGGSAVTVTTNTPGQNGVLTFEGTATQRVFLRVTGVSMTGGTNNWVNVSIKKPDGTNLNSAVVDSGGGYIDTQTLPVNGTYTVLADPTNASTGSLTLQLYNVLADYTDSIVPGGSAVTITTTSVGQGARVTFSGTANQRVFLRITGVSLTGGSPIWATVSIKKPDGSTLDTNTVDNSGGIIDTNTLPVTGTYTIVFDPLNTNTGTATLTLYDVPADITGSIIPGGSPVSVNNIAIGQSALLSFTGVATQRVSLAITGVTVTSGGIVTIRIKKPDGTTLGVTSVNGSGGFIDVQTLPVNGTYTILVDPNSFHTASATLTLYDVPADPSQATTINASAVTLTTTTPGQNAFITFPVTPTQQVTVRITDNQIGSIVIRLIRPDGTTQISNSTFNTTFNLSPQNLTVNGTYKVQIDPLGTGFGSVAVRVTSP